MLFFTVDSEEECRKVRYVPLGYELMNIRRSTVCLAALAVLAGHSVAAKDRSPRQRRRCARNSAAGSFCNEAGCSLLLRGTPHRARYDRYKRHTVEACAKALWKGFFDKKPDHPIKVYLFRGEAVYEKSVPKLAGFKPRTPYGFYLPSSEALMMNIDTGGGTLVHEMTHG